MRLPRHGSGTVPAVRRRDAGDAGLRFDSRAGERVESNRQLLAALQSIASLGGNLTDDNLENVGGINDGRDRAIKYVAARQIALAAIKGATL